MCPLYLGVCMAVLLAGTTLAGPLRHPPDLQTEEASSSVEEGDVSSETKRYNTQRRAKNYLAQFGYLKHGRRNATADDPHVIRALERFQRRAGLPVTGTMNNDTLTKMAQSRCGNPDQDADNDDDRRKRYTVYSPWSYSDLTYYIENFTPDMQQVAVVEEIRRAFKVWSDVSPLTFTRVFTTSADILIKFGAGSHGDPYPFDGPSGVLAHAYFPSNGDVHMDEDENFSYNTTNGYNMFQIIAHEFGHSLGISHSEFDTALMAPYYTGYHSNFQLHSDDIAAVQHLYGAPLSESSTASTAITTTPSTSSPSSTTTTISSTITSTTTPSGPVTTTPSLPDLCGDAQPDAVTSYQGSTFLLKGAYYVVLFEKTSVPRTISSMWPNLPANIDAAMSWPNTYRRGKLKKEGKTFFFKGTQVWRYGNSGLDAGFPKTISEVFPGVPDDLDAAYVYNRETRVVFTKGNQLYRYNMDNGGVVSGFPKQLDKYAKLPPLDAAASVLGRRYVFVQQRFYRIKDKWSKIKIKSSGDSTAAVWLDCDGGGNYKTLMAPQLNSSSEEDSKEDSEEFSQEDIKEDSKEH